MNSTDTQFIFSNEIRERVDPQTRSVMDVFEKQLVSLRSTIDQIPDHYSLSAFEDIRETHNNLAKAILSSTAADSVIMRPMVVRSSVEFDDLHNRRSAEMP
jgi:hypothetical protein